MLPLLADVIMFKKGVIIIKSKKQKGKYFAIKIMIVIFIIALVSVLAFNHFGPFSVIPPITYKADDFDIVTIKSEVDFNNNGIDDYADIVLGARIDANNKPVYNGAYNPNGYPPDNIGVCTDVVWRAFKNAGYNLRAMVDKDIKANVNDYPNVDKPDSNIDFRRVKNLQVYFKKFAKSLTTDVNKIHQWQGGDIVIFDNLKHIGIVSDKRNSKGQPLIIHNAGQPNREEDYINRSEIVAHYRFDASKINKNDLIAWQNS